jgi:hypothetical protein
MRKAISNKQTANAKSEKRKAKRTGSEENEGSQTCKGSLGLAKVTILEVAANSFQNQSKFKKRYIKGNSVRI